LFVSTV